jgi:integrase
VNQKVSELFPSYLDHCKQQKSPRTHKDIERIFDAHFSRLLGDQRLADLAPVHLRHYRLTRSTEKVIRGYEVRGVKKKVTGAIVSHRTINKELAYFAGFLKWCRRDLDMDLPPLHVDNLRTARPIPMVLSPDEVRRIIDAAGPVHKALILCLYSLGLRFSEAAGMKWVDVDLPGGMIRVIQKGGKWKALPLNPRAKTALEALKRKGEYVFPGRDPKKPLGDIRKALATICKKAGVTKKVNPHLFRHSFASHLMSGQINVSIIQRFLGHQQIQTTQWYSHVSMKNLSDASELISNLLDG